MTAETSSSPAYERVHIDHATNVGDIEPASALLHQDTSLEFDDLPPFPSDVPTVPLLRVNLHRLLQGDEIEEENLWRACCTLGFFYLDLRRPGTTNSSCKDSIDGEELLRDADRLFAIAEPLFNLPLPEKQSYDLSAEGSYFGYKGLGKFPIDNAGNRDRNEFWNISKNDVLNVSCSDTPHPNPPVLSQPDNHAHIAAFMRQAHAIITHILARLNTRLQLPDNALPDCHRLNAPSQDVVRWVRAPPQPRDARQAALGAHTDFGSVTLLFNRLGGLQVLPPAQNSWAYVKPLRGHCVVNLGDALVKLSAGILRSNIHRVVNPPGAQENEIRHSLVYFSRPEDQVLLKPLSGSPLIDARCKQHSELISDDDVVSSREWTLRRALHRQPGTDAERLEKRDSAIDA